VGWRRQGDTAALAAARKWLNSGTVAEISHCEISNFSYILEFKSIGVQT